MTVINRINVLSAAQYLLSDPSRKKIWKITFRVRSNIFEFYEVKFCEKEKNWFLRWDIKTSNIQYYFNQYVADMTISISEYM